MASNVLYKTSLLEPFFRAGVIVCDKIAFLNPQRINFLKVVNIIVYLAFVIL